MEIYSTEEQQVEAIKSWWQTNGNYVIVGILVGLATVWGWGYYKNWKVSSAEQASDAYQKAVSALEGGDASADAVISFVGDFQSSAYNPLLQLQLAKAQMDDNKPTDAAATLQAVVDKLGNENPVRSVARLRLAKAYIAAADNKAALASLDATFPEAFSAQADELRGDIYLLEGDKAAALGAYQAASSVEGGSASPLLQRKLDNLAGAAAQ